MIDTLMSTLEGWGANPWFPLVVLAVAALDAVFPIVPSETLVIVGGAVAAFGEQSLALIVLAASVGAFAGDVGSYHIGRTAERMSRRWGRRPLRTRLGWAERGLRRRSGTLILAARFMPGGRTAVTLASGLTHQPLGRFLALDAVAAIVWASYAAGLGYLFGRRFVDDHTTAFLISFVVAVGLSLLVELVRWMVGRVKRPDQAPAGVTSDMR